MNRLIYAFLSLALALLSLVGSGVALWNKQLAAGGFLIGVTMFLSVVTWLLFASVEEEDEEYRD